MIFSFFHWNNSTSRWQNCFGVDADEVLPEPFRRLHFIACLRIFHNMHCPHIRAIIHGTGRKVVHLHELRAMLKNGIQGQDFLPAYSEVSSCLNGYGGPGNDARIFLSIKPTHGSKMY
jgi:hypothetical protein